MLELWWIRHGETLWNAEHRWQGHSDVPLSLAGRHQALALRRRLATVRFDRVVSSDLRRAWTTARLAFPGHRPLRTRALRELHFGALEGKSWEEMTAAEREALQRWLEDPWHRAVSGGESLAALAERLERWLRSLPPRGRVAAVAHGGTIRTALQLVGVAQAAGALTANASITILRRRPHGGGWRLVRFNDTAHLERLPWVG